ncbi:MAG: hypothetical protein KAW09_08355 [Thermoplasmata archaeon]|nr:hypothetical protein [Thermoplasmata archaeon]
MSVVPPWAYGPFELILHAEEHLRKGEDFDRRIALISFDNSIEVAISTYLSLNPIQRGNVSYRKDDVEKWTSSYHTRLDFLEKELKTRGLTWNVEKGHIIWVHDIRNEQYHGGTKGTPEKQVLSIIREAALWIFSLLYGIQDVDHVLEDAMAATIPPTEPQPDDRIDRAIDAEYEMVEVCGQKYYTSEILFHVDSAAYKEIGSNLRQTIISGSDSEDTQW